MCIAYYCTSSFSISVEHHWHGEGLKAHVAAWSDSALWAIFFGQPYFWWGHDMKAKGHTSLCALYSLLGPFQLHPPLVQLIFILFSSSIIALSLKQLFTKQTSLHLGQVNFDSLYWIKITKIMQKFTLSSSYYEGSELNCTNHTLCLFSM